MSNYKYIKNQTGTSAEIYLYDEIGGFGVNANQFVQEFKYISEMVDVVKVRINSGGVSMVEGFGILSTLLTSKAKVYTYVDGLAASMASIIMLAGEKRFINDFALVMIHDPFNGGSSAKDKEIIQKFKDSALGVYESKTGRPREELSLMMSQETWMNASEALENGFVTDIINTSLPVEAKRKEIISVYNSLNKSSKMDNVANLLKVDATEEAVLASVQSTLNKVKELEDKIEALTAENSQAVELVETLNNKLKEVEEDKAETLVVNAIKDGKIEEDSKESWKDFAKNNFEAATKAIEGIKNTIKPSLSGFADGKSTVSNKLDEIRKSL